jgi:hypothetical protein
MDYPLENLGPERFQEFCQALLMKEHPSLQCFPVAQGKQSDAQKEFQARFERGGGVYVMARGTDEVERALR